MIYLSKFSAYEKIFQNVTQLKNLKINFDIDFLRF